MNRFKKTLTGVSAVLLIALGFVACDDDFSTVGGEIIENNNFSTELFSETMIHAYNKQLNPVQTNGVPVYQLGKNNDPVYGTTFSSITVQASLVTGTEDPEFGDFSQAEEDEDLTDFEENETVTEVWLHIPFFSSSSTNDDGDIEVKVDSLYGNTGSLFTLSVKELTYFLRSVDADGNSQAYFSDEDYAASTGVTLFPGDNFMINMDQVEVEETDATG
jgi:hypothetical protein